MDVITALLEALGWDVQSEVGLSRRRPEATVERGAPAVLD
jgi:hypothetical protein